MTGSESREIALYGAGGHARVCLDVLLETGVWSVVGALSDDGRSVDDLGVPMLDARSVLENATHSGLRFTFCVAIGDNHARAHISEKLTEGGHTLTEIVSRFAVVSPSARIGIGSQVLPGAVVMAAARLGHGVIVNTNASVDHDCDIGDHAHIAPGVAIGGGVSVGRRTLVGLGARVLPGVRIGDDAIVGAGAVVIGDVGDHETVVGNPAHVLRGDSR